MRWWKESSNPFRAAASIKFHYVESTSAIVAVALQESNKLSTWLVSSLNGFWLRKPAARLMITTQPNPFHHAKTFPSFVVRKSFRVVSRGEGSDTLKCRRCRKGLRNPFYVTPFYPSHDNLKQTIENAANHKNKINITFEQIIISSWFITFEPFSNKNSSFPLWRKQAQGEIGGFSWIVHQKEDY